MFIFVTPLFTLSCAGIPLQTYVFLHDPKHLHTTNPSEKKNIDNNLHNDPRSKSSLSQLQIITNK